MKTKRKVVAMPTGEVTQLVYNHRTHCFFYQDEGLNGKDNDYIHLYIVSDANIKESDYILIAGKIRKASKTNASCDNFKKVIATTDLSLNLPLIPERFVKEYCDANGIEEVTCEVNDSTVSISPLKESWSREEVEALCRKAYKEGQKERVFYGKCVIGYVFPSKNMKALDENEFINNNL